MPDTSHLPSDIAEADVIVVGSGVAGLFAAVSALDDGKQVVIVTKDAALESTTRYAQGGIAVAREPEDSPILHEMDTLACGGRLNDEVGVGILTGEARACVDRLVELGVEFDRDGPRLATTREAAHSRSRVIHGGGDATGLAVQSALLSHLSHRGAVILDHIFAFDLINSGPRAVGLTVATNGIRAALTLRNLFAPQVILASGGAGQLYARTTNPSVATGDGLALAYRAGAQLMDLEFFQFHPTALAFPGAPAFLISEATRGEGGVLRNRTGRAFMRDYSPEGDLAPRDVVSRAIWQEMKRDKAESVFLDLTHFPHGYVQGRFPTIFKTCRESGLDPASNLIPVAPAAHYFMGGVRTDLDGRTSIPGLFAVGEVACTGVHGANRLASNSLLEGLVFGSRAARAGPDPWAEESSEPQAFGKALFNQEDSRSQTISRPELQKLNRANLGIVRDEVGLRDEIEYLGSVDDNPPSSADNVAALELSNMLLASRLMARAAEARKESRGAHYRSDFPESDDRWLGHIVVSGHESFFVPVKTPRAEAISA